MRFLFACIFGIVCICYPLASQAEHATVLACSTPQSLQGLVRAYKVNKETGENEYYHLSHFGQCSEMLLYFRVLEHKDYATMFHKRLQVLRVYWQKCRFTPRLTCRDYKILYVIRH